MNEEDLSFDNFCRAGEEGQRRIARYAEMDEAELNAARLHISGE